MWEVIIGGWLPESYWEEGLGSGEADIQLCAWAAHQKPIVCHCLVDGTNAGD